MPCRSSNRCFRGDPEYSRGGGGGVGGGPPAGEQPPHGPATAPRPHTRPPPPRHQRPGRTSTRVFSGPRYYRGGVRDCFRTAPTAFPPTPQAAKRSALPLTGPRPSASQAGQHAEDAAPHEGRQQQPAARHAPPRPRRAVDLAARRAHHAPHHARDIRR